MIHPVQSILESRAARRCLWTCLIACLAIKSAVLLFCVPDESPLYPRF